MYWSTRSNTAYITAPLLTIEDIVRLQLLAAHFFSSFCPGLSPVLDHFCDLCLTPSISKTMTKPKNQYERIDLATDAIRLVRVLRDDHDGPVRCELFQSYLDRGVGVPYEALSYTWGDPNVPKVPIDIINEFTGRASTLLVLPNLHDILRYLRLPNKDRVLWIDAICIDQDQHTASLKERTHQVGQMRLVYENADRVVAWLGYFSDASLMVQEPQAIATLMDFATELDHLAMSLATDSPALMHGKCNSIHWCILAKSTRGKVLTDSQLNKCPWPCTSF